MKKIKFNFIDIIIVFVVVVAFVVCIKFVTAKEPDTSGGFINVIGVGEKNSIHYTVEIRRTPLDYKYNYNKGDRVYDSNTGAFLGIVEAVEAKPAVESIADLTNGQFVMSEYPEKEDVYVTLSVVPEVKDKGFWIGGHFIKVGKLMKIQKMGCVGEGYIVDVDTKSKGGTQK